MQPNLAHDHIGNTAKDLPINTCQFPSPVVYSSPWCIGLHFTGHYFSKPSVWLGTCGD